MKYIIQSLFFLILLLLFSCKTEDATPTPEVEMPTTENPSTNNPTTGNEQYLNEKSGYIFDQKKLPTFEFTGWNH